MSRSSHWAWDELGPEPFARSMFGAPPGTGTTSPGRSRTRLHGALPQLGATPSVPPGTCPGTPTPPTPGCVLSLPPGTWPGTPTPPTPGVVLSLPPGRLLWREPTRCAEALLASTRRPNSKASAFILCLPREGRHSSLSRPQVSRSCPLADTPHTPRLRQALQHLLAITVKLYRIGQIAGCHVKLHAHDINCPSHFG